ncbi:uncharacterized protein LOC131929467 isoform X2 [Physella acuta]|uniref:uncharacterized protein LOC131929467 isoform X2 n=1 Tax=Physella acuta TaxID=109671 RepID=UPI0027DACE0A|nr:uncharacterized protein LOC131929467 isoform X2 [Physella acuta]
MLTFGSFRGQRLTFDVPVGMTIHQLKEMIKEKLGISGDLYKQDKKVLALSYAGAELGDHWVFSDLGILHGSSIKIQLKEEVKPALYIRCSHSLETVPVYEDIGITHRKMCEIRSIASMKSGLPVGIFRLTTADGREMYDTHSLDDYGVDIGHTILLENWDGWNEFLNLAIMGFTPQVISQLSDEDVLARYQMKVALFIAAHFGHVDLAKCLLRLGCRAGEGTGYHPARSWCQENGHKDSLKSPVHEATLYGQLGVLRLFVNHDITCLKAKDADGLEPINLALRHNIRNCASFLLTKQWTKVPLTRSYSVHLGTFASIKNWCERAKEQVLLKHGLSKSSINRRIFHPGPMVGHGVFVDGYSPSPMNGKPKAQLQRESRDLKEEDKLNQRSTWVERSSVTSVDDPESYFKSIMAAERKSLQKGQGRYQLRWGKTMNETKSVNSFAKVKAEVKKTAGNDVTHRRLAGDTPAEAADQTSDVFKSRFPAITGANRNVTVYHEAKVNVPLSQSDAEKNDDVGTQTQKGEIRLVKNSKNAFFVTSHLRKDVNGVENQLTGNVAVAMETNDTNKPDACVSVMSDKSRDVPKNGKPNIDPAVVSGVSQMGSDVTDDASSQGRQSRRRRRGKISNAMLLSRAKSSEGPIPLPLISHEQARRPFFYHQGQREEEFLEKTLKLVSKYKGDSSRERAIKTLTMANSFKGKPWLSQVRVALSVSNNSLKRSVCEM